MTNDFDEFLKDKDNLAAYSREKLIVEITQAILTLMDEQKVSIDELSSRIVQSPGFVTKMLDGDRSISLAFICDCFTALGKKIEIKVVPI